MLSAIFPNLFYFFPSLSRSTSFVYLFLFFICSVPHLRREGGWISSLARHLSPQPAPHFPPKAFDEAFPKPFCLCIRARYLEWLLTCTFFRILYVKIIFYRRILFSLEKKRKRRGKASTSPAFSNQRKRIYSPFPQPPLLPATYLPLALPFPLFHLSLGPHGDVWGHVTTPLPQHPVEETPKP